MLLQLESFTFCFKDANHDSNQCTLFVQGKMHLFYEVVIVLTTINPFEHAHLKQIFDTMVFNYSF
jgi:hypothetical protein